jgi:hypothetical protein
MDCCYVANIALLLVRAAVVRHAARALDQHLGFVGVTHRSRRAVSGSVVKRHDRLDQTGAVNPADAACSDVYIPTVVRLFPRE